MIPTMNVSSITSYNLSHSDEDNHGKIEVFPYWKWAVANWEYFAHEANNNRMS